jgi:tRNA(adenine34) deaminase
MRYQEKSKEYFMSIALNEARKAYSKNEVPVGCVIVSNDKIIARGHNTRQKTHNILGHAELVAIRKASKKKKTWILEDCVMYVTLEPCNLCEEAIKQSRISKIYISCEKTRNDDKIIVEKVFGLMEKESEKLLKNFFKEKRNK